MRKLIIVVLVGLCVSYLVRPNAAQQLNIPPKVNTNVKSLMQRKLDSSQSLIKGLALDDFELLAKEAQTLRLLSLDAGWNVIQTKEYAQISGEFLEATKRISEASEKKNLDAAGLAYFRLTMTCIDCHRHVRSTTVK